MPKKPILNPRRIRNRPSGIRLKPSKSGIPSEDQEQIWLFEWAKLQECAYPDLKWLVAIPNGMRTPMREALTMNAMGMKSGFPDMILPIPHGIHVGLAIELKRTDAALSQVSPNQKMWLHALADAGWRAVVCFGWQQASSVILSYLEHPRGRIHL